MIAMILGTGVDLLEISRMERILERQGDPDRIFAPSELEACEREGFSGRRRAERLAGLFAAKEAVMKVLGKGWFQGPVWTDIVIRHTEDGAPEATLSGESARIAAERGINRIHVSITHAAGLAVAFAVGEGSE